MYSADVNFISPRLFFFSFSQKKYLLYFSIRRMAFLFLCSILYFFILYILRVFLYIIIYLCIVGGNIKSGNMIKKVIFLCKNKSKIYNKIFSYDILLSRKLIIKIAKYICIFFKFKWLLMILVICKIII